MADYNPYYNPYMYGFNRRQPDGWDALSQIGAAIFQRNKDREMAEALIPALLGQQQQAKQPAQMPITPQQQIPQQGNGFAPTQELWDNWSALNPANQQQPMIPQQQPIQQQPIQAQSPQITAAPQQAASTQQIPMQQQITPGSGFAPTQDLWDNWNKLNPANQQQTQSLSGLGNISAQPSLAGVTPQSNFTFGDFLGQDGKKKNSGEQSPNSQSFNAIEQQIRSDRLAQIRSFVQNAGSPDAIKQWLPVLMQNMQNDVDLAKRGRIEELYGQLGTAKDIDTARAIYGQLSGLGATVPAGIMPDKDTYGWVSAPNGDLIRTDNSGNISDMGNYAKPQTPSFSAGRTADGTQYIVNNNTGEYKYDRKFDAPRDNISANVANNLPFQMQKEQLNALGKVYTSKQKGFDIWRENPLNMDMPDEAYPGYQELLNMEAQLMNAFGQQPSQQQQQQATAQPQQQGGRRAKINGQQYNSLYKYLQDKGYPDAVIRQEIAANYES